MKKTKIIATIGPASEETETLKRLDSAGANIFRLNFSHGTHEWHSKVIERIHKINETRSEKIGIIVDTRGPEIRTGDLPEPKKLRKGEHITLTVKSDFDPEKEISVSYDKFVEDVRLGEKILVDNGMMNFMPVKKRGKYVICEVLDDGTLHSCRHLNLPGRDISLDSITDQDWEDIDFAIDHNVDFIALSFVRGPEDILKLKGYLAGKRTNIAVISKIECLSATERIDEICEVSDGVMVARGDLGVEIDFFKVPRVQSKIIAAAEKATIPVIIATQMLESMIENPMPTRAEVSDVAHAVNQRVDALLLSGETAAGKYPVRSVKYMTKICEETESVLPAKIVDSRKMEIKSERDEFAKIAANITEDLPEIKAIMVFSKTGFTAEKVAAYRPRVPIVTFTDSPYFRSKISLFFGVRAFEIPFSERPERTIQSAKTTFLDSFPQFEGYRIVLASASLVGGEIVPMIQIREF